LVSPPPQAHNNSSNSSDSRNSNSNSKSSSSSGPCGNTRAQHWPAGVHTACGACTCSTRSLAAAGPYPAGGCASAGSAYGRRHRRRAKRAAALLCPQGTRLPVRPPWRRWRICTRGTAPMSLRRRATARTTVSVVPAPCQSHTCTSGQWRTHSQTDRTDRQARLESSTSKPSATLSRISRGPPTPQTNRGFPSGMSCHMVSTASRHSSRDMPTP
jgi:hypothetical protein